MNNKKTITAIVFAFVLLSAVVLEYIIIKRQTVRTAYVNLSDLYNQFELKKSLEQKMISINASTKSYLDSLKMQIIALNRQIEQSGKNKALEETLINQQTFYASKKAEFEERDKKIEEQFEAQIWTQINQYVKDYGDENKYDYIFGAQGSGSIMYAKKKNDKTAEVSEYINKRQRGN